MRTMLAIIAVALAGFAAITIYFSPRALLARAHRLGSLKEITHAR